MSKKVTARRQRTISPRNVKFQNKPCTGCFLASPRYSPPWSQRSARNASIVPRDDDDLPLADSLARIFMVDISEEAERERVEILRLVIVEGRNFPELSDILKRHGLEFSRAELADWLTRQSARGRLKAGDMTALAQMLIDMVFGAITLGNIGDLEWPGAEQRRAHIHNCIDVFLHGVCPGNKRG